MKRLLISILLALSACTTHIPKLSSPAPDAPVWNLNPGRWTPATNDLNDLVHEPSTMGMR
jgi:hypothetical protein